MNPGIPEFENVKPSTVNPLHKGYCGRKKQKPAIAHRRLLRILGGTKIFISNKVSRS